MKAPKLDYEITERMHLMAIGKIAIPDIPFCEFQALKKALIRSIQPPEEEQGEIDDEGNVEKYKTAYRLLLSGSYVRCSKLCDEIRESYFQIGEEEEDARLLPSISLPEAVLFWKASMIAVIIVSMINNAAWVYRESFTLLPDAIRKEVLREVFGEDVPGALTDGKFELLFYLIVEENFRAFHHRGKGRDVRPCFVTWTEDLDALKDGHGLLDAE
ncbi:MAG: hypothetical protein Q9200_000004 [Gallowayella weberi]